MWHKYWLMMNSSSHWRACINFIHKRRNPQFKVVSERQIFERLFIAILFTLMMFSFLQRKCNPLTRCIKKIADHTCHNLIFIWEEQNTNIKKGYACVHHLLQTVARSLLFRLHILSACFYNKKEFLILNANFWYYWQCSLNNVMFP